MDLWSDIPPPNNNDGAECITGGEANDNNLTLINKINPEYTEEKSTINSWLINKSAQLIHTELLTRKPLASGMN